MDTVTTVSIIILYILYFSIINVNYTIDVIINILWNIYEPKF